MKLIETATGKELKPGDSVITFRNKPAILVSIKEPEHVGSTGKVIIRFPNDVKRVFFPSVIGAQFE